jgi:hypothetical protein
MSGQGGISANKGKQAVSRYMTGNITGGFPPILKTPGKQAVQPENSVISAKLPDGN